MADPEMRREQQYKSKKCEFYLFTICLVLNYVQPGETCGINISAWVQMYFLNALLFCLFDMYKLRG